MNRAFIAVLACLAFAMPAHAVTVVNGVVLITQADALAGGVTPGDAPGFPVTLSATGSYRFASNLLLNANVNGINVTAPEVTIDLYGFRLAGSGIGAIGISGSQRGLAVKDGTVRGFLQDGVRVTAQFLTVSNMVIADNGGAGVVEDGAAGFARVLNSSVVRNASGVVCAFSCHVEGNNISSNTANGIVFSRDGGLALGNNIIANGQFGIVVLLQFNLVNSAGFGNNAIFRNTLGPTSGAVVALQPNACGPQAC